MEFSIVSQTVNGLLIHVAFKVETEGTEQLLDEPCGETVFVICFFSSSRRNFKSQNKKY